MCAWLYQNLPHRTCAGVEPLTRSQPGGNRWRTPAQCRHVRRGAPTPDPWPAVSPVSPRSSAWARGSCLVQRLLRFRNVPGARIERHRYQAFLAVAPSSDRQRIVPGENLVGNGDDPGLLGFYLVARILGLLVHRFGRHVVGQSPHVERQVERFGVQSLCASRVQRRTLYNAAIVL